MRPENAGAEALFGAAVRRFRRERRLSQARLGKRAGLHRTYIGGIERGERNLSLRNIIAIAQALRVPPAALFDAAEREVS